MQNNVWLRGSIFAEESIHSSSITLFFFFFGSRDFEEREKVCFAVNLTKIYIPKCLSTVRQMISKKRLILRSCSIKRILRAINIKYNWRSWSLNLNTTKKHIDNFTQRMPRHKNEKWISNRNKKIKNRFQVVIINLSPRNKINSGYVLASSKETNRR